MKTPSPRRPRPAQVAPAPRRPAPPPKCKGRPTYIVDDIVDFR
ncbi:MAG: hypothetical protein R3F61_17025 [Myxococcota bacterium]